MKPYHDKGTVYWITGLSGAGKTTIGKLLYQKIKEQKQHVVFFDGDHLRIIFGESAGYNAEERKKLSMQYSRLAHGIAEQGIDVVLAVMAMFDDVRQWNRENISSYKEIYLKAPMNVLFKRDIKEIYRKTLAGERKNVVGIDLPIEEPKNPDLVVENDGKNSPEDIAELIFNRIKTI